MNEAIIDAIEDLICARSQAIRNMVADLIATQDPDARKILLEIIALVQSHMRRLASEQENVSPFRRKDPGGRL